MKTFFHLIQEVQKPGLCHRCGGCVTFCTAINYGALELDPEGKPRYKDIEKCIECGLCYSICPEIAELDEETRRLTGWSAPVGRMLHLAMARASEPDVRSRATDGGVVTALLLHLFEMGRIDGAIVSGSVGAFHREPMLAVTREDILGAAGFHFDTVHGMAHFSGIFSAMYSSFVPSVLKLGDVTKRRLDRVAFVGTPCQINALRRMEVLGIVPSGSIKYHFGLFCSGNFTFGEKEKKRLEEEGGFIWDDVLRVNIKEDLMVHLRGGGIKRIALERLDFMKRYACRYCGDYTAEFADLSFGGIGAPDGWTTVIVRSPLGRAVMADARGSDIEEISGGERQRLISQATAKVLEWSALKKEKSEANHRELERKSLKFKH